MHCYNNQDHSMLSALLAAESIMGANHDLWQVNTELFYYKDFVTDDKKSLSQVGVGIY